MSRRGLPYNLTNVVDFFFVFSSEAGSDNLKFLDSRKRCNEKSAKITMLEMAMIIIPLYTLSLFEIKKGKKSIKICPSGPINFLLYRGLIDLFKKQRAASIVKLTSILFVIPSRNCQ